MTTKQTKAMLAHHRKMARAFRAVGKESDAQAADRRGAECQAVLQVTPEYETWCPDCGKGLEAKGDLSPMELRSHHFYQLKATRRADR